MKKARKGRRAGYDKNFVGVTQKMFALLEALSQQPKAGVPLDELTELSGLPKTTVHRLLYSMNKLGYVEQDPVTNLYSLSGKFFELGTNALPYQRLTVVAKPLMQRLLLTFGESVNLAVPQSGTLIYILVLESPKAHRVAATVGSYSHLHCTSVGKSIAAYLPAEELQQHLTRHGMPPLTVTTITTLEQFEQELTRARGGRRGRQRRKYSWNYLLRRPHILERSPTHCGAERLRPHSPDVAKPACHQGGGERSGANHLDIAGKYGVSSRRGSPGREGFGTDFVNWRPLRRTSKLGWYETRANEIPRGRSAFNFPVEPQFLFPCRPDSRCPRWGIRASQARRGLADCAALA